jgi:hypothetical protein
VELTFDLNLCGSKCGDSEMIGVEQLLGHPHENNLVLCDARKLELAIQIHQRRVGIDCGVVVDRDDRDQIHKRRKVECVAKHKGRICVLAIDDRGFRAILTSKHSAVPSS